MTYPDVCLQSLIDPDDWWISDNNASLERGALIEAFVPHIDQTPYSFEPIGRKDAGDHATASVKVAPLKVDQPLKQTQLPVAAMPLMGKEVWVAYRAKRRPCLVLGTSGLPVAKSLTQGKPNHATAPTLLVAPYYGAVGGDKRAGYDPRFIERIRKCEYPQFVWDHLPHKSGEESILRLDQAQPIGTHHASYRSLNFRLHESAMMIVDELLQWLVSGSLPEDGWIESYTGSLE